MVATTNACHRVLAGWNEQPERVAVSVIAWQSTFFSKGHRSQLREASLCNEGYPPDADFKEDLSPPWRWQIDKVIILNSAIPSWCIVVYKRAMDKIGQCYSSTSLKNFFPAPQTGHFQSSGRSSNLVSGGILPLRSPFLSVYIYPQLFPWHCHILMPFFILKTAVEL